MDWIVTTGATIDAALESALDELSVTHDDVEYEILKQPSFSLLRLRRHPAQVRTRVKPVEPQQNANGDDRLKIIDVVKRNLPRNESKFLKRSGTKHPKIRTKIETGIP